MNKSNEIKNLFNKKVTFENNENFALPKEVFTSPKWSLPALQEKKEKLNSVKSLLNDFPLEEWSRHTKSREPSASIIRRIKKVIEYELITQAWCKFYECLSNFDIVPKPAIRSKKFTSVHLCEAPGAFISALHYFINRNCLELNWNWCANTLNPDYEGNSLAEMIPDDRLLRHTHENWYFGNDFSGDITKYHNHLDIVAKIKDKGNVWLVTADGSIDCMSDPGNQERFVEFLHYCETLTALSLLEKGGTFVLKIFTFFEEPTVCLLYLLNTVFKEVSIFKPGSSKSGNSEVYVICLHFRGLEILEKTWESIILPYKAGSFDSNTSLFDLNSINSNFLDHVISCSEYFMLKQIETINGNVFYFKNMNQSEISKVGKVRDNVARRYIKLFNIKAIPCYFRLIAENNIAESMITRVADYMFKSKVIVFTTNSLIQLPPDLKIDGIIDIKYGKRIDEVKSSRFCKSRYFNQIPINYAFEKVQGSLYQIISNKLSQTTTIIDTHYCSFKNYYEFQRYIFYQIYNSNKNNFIFVKIPFVTNFLAGLLLLVISCYEKLYFYKNGCLILSDSTGESIFKVKQLLDKIHSKYRTIPSCQDFSYDLLQVISPNLLYNNEYFKFLWNYNNIVLSKS